MTKGDLTEQDVTIAGADRPLAVFASFDRDAQGVYPKRYLRRLKGPSGA